MIAVVMSLSISKALAYELDSRDLDVINKIDRYLNPWESLRVFDWGNCCEN